MLAAAGLSASGAGLGGGAAAVATAPQESADLGAVALLERARVEAIDRAVQAATNFVDWATDMVEAAEGLKQLYIRNGASASTLALATEQERLARVTQLQVVGELRVAEARRRLVDETSRYNLAVAVGQAATARGDAAAAVGCLAEANARHARIFAAAAQLGQLAAEQVSRHTQLATR
jgi:hypothetical protein